MSIPVAASTRICIAGCLLLSLIGVAGCQSFSTLGRARTLGPGRVEAWLAPQALVIATDSGASVRPTGEVGVRVGVTRSLELDARITTLGLTLGPRVQLRRSASSTRGLDIAIAPGVGLTWPDKLAVEAPVLFGINLPGEHQIVLAPRVTYQARLGVPGAPGPVSFVYLGASVGVALRLTARVTLMPEVALATQVYADPGYASNVAGGVGMQGSIGILIDP